MVVRVVLVQCLYAYREASLQVYNRGHQSKPASLVHNQRALCDPAMWPCAAPRAVLHSAGEVGAAEFDQAILRTVAGVERKSAVLSADEKTVVARHEAGHAAVSTAVARLLPRASARREAVYCAALRGRSRARAAPLQDVRVLCSHRRKCCGYVRNDVLGPEVVFFGSLAKLCQAGTRLSCLGLALGYEASQ